MTVSLTASGTAYEVSLGVALLKCVGPLPQRLDLFGHGIGSGTRVPKWIGVRRRDSDVHTTVGFESLLLPVVFCRATWKADQRDDQPFPASDL